MAQHTVTSFVWKREEKEEERGGKWAGGCLTWYYQYAPLNDTCGGAYFLH